MSVYEWMISVILLTAAALYLFYIFKARTEEEKEEQNIHSIEALCEEIKKRINEIINMDLNILRLNKNDLESRREVKRSLREATRGCSHGNIHMKMIVLARIKKTLAGSLGITEEVIDTVLPFGNHELLTSTDRFEIMMYLEKREGNCDMFRSILNKAGLGQLIKEEGSYHYDITEKDLEAAFHQLISPLSYDDKLNIITQRIYQDTYGLSVVDLLIMEDESVDSISGGVSGLTQENCRYKEEDIYCGAFRKPMTYDSIWVVCEGKPIHLKFLSFGSPNGIVRVCKNLSEHGRNGHFTSSEGGSKNHLANGSRVTTFRPYNASQWAFFVRKFGTTSHFELKDLITDNGSRYPIELLKWCIRGCVNLIFSGDQNSGKTTNMRAAVMEIDKRQQIRTVEADFELYLNDAYYDRNILGTRPSKSIGFAKLIELLKASEAHTILFGETASLEQAKHLLDLLLAGTKRVITTGHWSTADDILSYFVLAHGGYGNAGTQDIERVIARLLHIDVHHVKDNDGHRYIDRITEIIPREIEETKLLEKEKQEGVDRIADILEHMYRGKAYDTRDIVIYENGKYRMVHPISDRLTDIILRNLPPEERSNFLEFNQISGGGVRKAC